jgi:hypothetical protein
MNTLSSMKHLDISCLRPLRYKLVVKGDAGGGQAVDNPPYNDIIRSDS